MNDKNNTFCPKKIQNKSLRKHQKTYNSIFTQTFGSSPLRHWVTLTNDNANNKILKRQWRHCIILHSINKMQKVICNNYFDFSTLISRLSSHVLLDVKTNSSLNIPNSHGLIYFFYILRGLVVFGFQRK